MFIYLSRPSLYYLSWFSSVPYFSYAEMIQTAKFKTLFTLLNNKHKFKSLDAYVLIKEGRCLCISRTTIYKLRSTYQLIIKKSTYQLVLLKHLNGSKHFILPKSTKVMEQQIQHPKTMQSHID